MSEKKTPDAWCDQYGLEARDPDGWRADQTPWTEPITLPEFWRRYTGSTARLVSSVEYERILADVRAAEREGLPAPRKTTERRVHIENRNPDGKKILTGGRITVDGEDISGHVLAVDIHMDPRSLPTARLEMIGLDVDIEAVIDAVEAQPDDGGVVHGDLVAGADPILCIQCLLDRHNGTRTDEPNPAQVMVNGNSSCLDHFQIIDGPAIPDRTPNGLIIPGANGSHN